MAHDYNLNVQISSWWNRNWWRYMLAYVLVRSDRVSKCHPVIHSARHSPVVAADLRYFGVPESNALPCYRHVRLDKEEY
ncbi:hypothetical protein TNCV_1384031 [Trichonephila clavipes]|nr:hypothetical protein TNCV_1384031 [Trichonephila clavipes]